MEMLRPILEVLSETHFEGVETHFLSVETHSAQALIELVKNDTDFPPKSVDFFCCCSDAFLRNSDSYQTALHRLGQRHDKAQGNLRLLGVTELWVQELVQARKLVNRKVGTDDNPADLDTKYIEDPHLLSLGGLRLKGGA